MGKDHYAAIFASSPMNATAGHVTAKGYQYAPAVKIAATEWDAPPKLRPVLKNMPNLIGEKFGRLTVVGLLDESAKSNGAKWVCRCVCGKYVSRKARAIANPANSEDRCTVCRHQAHLLRESSARRIAERKALGCERTFCGSTNPKADT